MIMLAATLGLLSDRVRPPDHLAESCLMLSEWAAILFYPLRDGPLPDAPPRQ
jgi:hypothetical protein